MIVRRQLQTADSNGRYKGELADSGLSNADADGILLGHVNDLVVQRVRAGGDHGGPVVPVKAEVERGRWVLAIVVPVEEVSTHQHSPLCHVEVDVVAVLLPGGEHSHCVHHRREGVGGWNGTDFTVGNVRGVARPHHTYLVGVWSFSATVDAHENCEKNELVKTVGDKEIDQSKEISLANHQLIIERGCREIEVDKGRSDCLPLMPWWIVVRVADASSYINTSEGVFSHPRWQMLFLVGQNIVKILVPD